METKISKDDLKDIFREELNDYNNLKQKNITSSKVLITLNIIISLALIIGYLSSPLKTINRMEGKIQVLEHLMRENHPKTKDIIPNPFVTRQIKLPFFTIAISNKIDGTKLK